MAKGCRGRRRIVSRQYQSMPYPLMPCNPDILNDLCPRRCSKGLDKKDWEDVTCSVCMEYPHKAVLLLCSSHDNGCRPYMCGTSFRYSNCLDLYKKAYTKVIPSSGTAVENRVVVSDSGWPVEKCDVSEVSCPLCRGQVKGWTVVEPAREYLNEKGRNCMQDDCSFFGSYKELRKHMRADHPCAKPRELDPVLEQKWRRLERERERDDVMSTIRSAMPGAMVLGDYVIEGNRHDFDIDEDGRFDANGGRHGSFGVGLDGNLVNFLLQLQLHPAFGPLGDDLISRQLRQSERAYRHLSDDGTAGVQHGSPVGSFNSSDQDDDRESNNDNGDDGSVSLVNRLRRHGRVLLGRSARRGRLRETNGSNR